MALTIRSLSLLAVLGLLVSCGSGGDGDSEAVVPPVDRSPRIIGTVFDASTGLPIRDAVVTSEPATEEVSSGADGTYALRASAGSGGEFRVFVTHVGYEASDARTSVSNGETTRVDFSLDSNASGLVASPTTVIVRGDASTETFRLTSTVANTGFSIQSGAPWATVSRPTGTIVNRETTIITVSVDRDALGGAGSGELVINPDNGTGAVIVNLVVEAGGGNREGQSDCRRPDVLRVGLPNPGADLVQFVDSVMLPAQSGLRRRVRVPDGNPVYFDSIEVTELGTISIEHADGGPESTVMELFELDAAESIVNLAESGDFDVAGARARVDFAVLPGTYCFYIADSNGAFGNGTELVVDYRFQPPR